MQENCQAISLQDQTNKDIFLLIKNIILNREFKDIFILEDCLEKIKYNNFQIQAINRILIDYLYFAFLQKDELVLFPKLCNYALSSFNERYIDYQNASFQSNYEKLYNTQEKTEDYYLYIIFKQALYYYTGGRGIYKNNDSFESEFSFAIPFLYKDNYDKITDDFLLGLCIIYHYINTDLKISDYIKESYNCYLSNFIRNNILLSSKAEEKVSGQNPIDYEEAYEAYIDETVNEMVFNLGEEEN